jgi:DME family drug/metabolite transporter
LVNPIPALIPAIIWAIDPIYYRVFQQKVGFLELNLLRTCFATSALVVPAVVFGGFSGLNYAALSGIITLGVGDSLFLLALRMVGASVATPVVYLYVLIIQFTATSVGEAVPLGNFVSAGLVVVGVILLSSGAGGRPRLGGILTAVAASVAWAGGNEIVKLATNAGGGVFAVAFMRDASAALALGVVLVAFPRMRPNLGHLTLRGLLPIAVVAVADLALGSTLYIYSISTSGIALTVILTSVSPFLAQVFSRALGKETPRPRDYLGGLIIFVALLVAVL